MTRWLRRSDPWVLNAFAVACAFATYFCMYAFRKPFTAATYEGESIALLGIAFSQKSVFIIAQLLGYALSKYLGVWVNSEVRRGARLGLLVGLIVLAEASLVLFGAAPPERGLLKAAALFGNGAPLGMVWGLVVQYLEGRRMSEVLLTGLSCSYIVASGVVKDVGRALLAGADFSAPGFAAVGLSLPNPLPPVGEYWMPAATGALFLPLFLLAAWLLDQVPEPTAADVQARNRRDPMLRHDRRRFLRRYAVAVAAALAAYFALTAYRDYRDTYLVETFNELGYDYAQNKTVVSRAETLVALGVAAILSQLYRFRDNRRGLVATYAVMAAGMLLIGAATLALDTGRLSGFGWVTLIGVGAYLAYIPFGAMLFDRAMACSGFAGTAVFAIYVADALGYTGSVALYLSADMLFSEASPLAVTRRLSYAVAVVGPTLLLVSCLAFLRRGAEPAAAPAIDPSPPAETVA